jgi:hypothetical protein
LPADGYFFNILVACCKPDIQFNLRSGFGPRDRLLFLLDILSG